MLFGPRNVDILIGRLILSHFSDRYIHSFIPFHKKRIPCKVLILHYFREYSNRSSKYNLRFYLLLLNQSLVRTLNNGDLLYYKNSDDPKNVSDRVFLHDIHDNAT